MLQRGRKSLEAKSIAANPQSSLQVIRRLEPPSILNRAQREVWFRLVDSYPADWFPPGSALLLAQLARHVVDADKVAQLIEDCPEDDPRGFNSLLQLQERETTTIAMLATRLKLTPQSVTNHRGNNRPGTTTTTVPWEDDEDE